jgi:tetratricopeptide (TPR) repeat protein/DNA-binding MarR family transcriptional regulator
MNSCTIGNRVLIHLSCLSRHREDFVCPPDMTQDGIASRLGISRAHVALELKRLEKRSQVEYRLAHVVRAKSRRKVYSLTRAGDEIAGELKDAARRKTVRLLDHNGGTMCLGTDALKVLCSSGYSESEAFIKILTTETMTIEGGRRNGNESPVNTDLIGRGQELERLNRWLRSPGKAVCVLAGADGTGKSSLAASLASSFDGISVMRPVRPMQSVRSVLSGIASILAAKGKRKLQVMLGRDDFDPREAVLALAEEMAGGLLVLDDAHNSSEFEDFAGLFMSMNDWPLKVLVISRRKPGFCQRWADTFQRPYEDVPVAGLDLESARKLVAMHAKAMTDGGVSAAHAATQGRPLDLILLAELGWSFDIAEVPTIAALVRSRMTEEEMDTLRIAAVVRTSFDPALLALTLAQESLLSRKSLFQSDDGRFMLHETLRNLVVEGMGVEERWQAHLRAGALEEARGDFVRAASHYIDAGLGDKAADLLSSMDPSGAKDSAVELLCILRAIGDDRRLETLRGKTVESLGRLDEARLCYERAAGAMGGLSPYSLLALGDIESRMSMHDEAERHFSMAMNLAREGKDEVMRARALRGLAGIRRFLGDFDGAAAHLAEARGVLESAGEWTEAVRCRAELGVVELERGNPAGAVAELTSAAQSSGQCDTHSAKVLSDLGIAYQRLGDEERAVARFLEAVKVAESFGQAKVAARALAGAAESRLRTGKSIEAEELCGRALRLGERLDDPVLLSMVHATLGVLNKNLGLWKRAESHIVTSIELLKPLNSPKALAGRYRDLATLYEKTGDARKARLWNTRAERMMEWVDSGQSTGQVFS